MTLTALPPVAAPPVESPWRRAARQLLRRPSGVVALGFVLLLIVLAALAPWVAPHDPLAQDLSDAFAPYSGEHWLGTDDLGRDVASRLIHAIRLALLAPLISVGVALLLGVPTGLWAGLSRGWVDTVLSRIADALLSLPGLAFALAIIAVVGPGLTNVMIALGIVFAPSLFRVVRGAAMAVAEEPFIDAARSIGSPTHRILGVHVLPNVAAPLLVQATILMGFGAAGGGRPELPRPRCAAACGQLGIDAAHRVRPPVRGTAVGAAAGHRRGDHGAGVQHHRRRDPRRHVREGAAMSELASESWAQHAATGIVKTTRPALDARGLRARGLVKSYPGARGAFGRPLTQVRAVDGVDVDVTAGMTLGVVGESGSGKSTLGRLVSLLERPDEGTVVLDGRDTARLRGRELTRVRRSLQVVFQDPFGSLDPTKTIAHAVAEPLLVHGRVRRAGMLAAAEDLLVRVGLDPGLARRYPEQLSGGQRQRVCIARALALEPWLLVADEPTSALDLSTRSEILNLLLTLQQETGLSILLVSHDFATIQHLAHRVAVMYLGRVVEEGPTADVVANPLHPYTKALLSAVPVPDPAVQRARRRIVLHGEVPNPTALPSGCRFRSRCGFAMPECATTDPGLGGDRHRVACLLHTERRVESGRPRP
ncbi:oligopeptide/dipeptide ABC transporter ATP-binding protein [Pseudonocardia sp. CA-107938]|uniref:oligopeptide/dipeptide ABC transporter ATP-binding protein n=1 Tax=Pseudonocardia sp. CA-107938 TaxID=3240021 RepID=UPI003D922C66